MSLFSCPSCTKMFSTQQGRDMHFEAKHATDCVVCGKHFRTVRAMNQHLDAVHPEDTDDESNSTRSYWPEDPVDGPGRWVYLADFRGNKSFGVFECESCDKTWISAHAYREYDQGCSECEHYNPPKLMWQNDKKSGQAPTSNLDLSKPHKIDLCGACAHYGQPCWQVYASDRN